MAPSTINMTTIITAISVLLALLGGGLCWWGLFPRRRGETPFCRKCGYNLTGLALDALGAACPECGAPVGVPGHFVIGARKRRPVVAALGGFLLLVSGGAGGVVTSGVLRTVNWYPLKPTFWLLRELKTPTAGQAVAELEARRLAGKLTIDDLAKWIDAAIAAEAAPRRSAAQRVVIDSLGPLLAAQQITPEQLARFGQAVSRNVAFAVRSRAVVGELIPYQLNCSGYVPAGLTLRVVDRRVELHSNGTVLRDSRGGAGFSASGAVDGPYRTYFPGLPIGRHEVQFLFALELVSGTFSWQAPACWSQESVFDSTVDVVAPEVGDSTQLVGGGGDWARRHIRLRQIVVTNAIPPRPPGVGRHLSAVVDYDPAAPMAFASDVIASDGTRRVVLGEATMRAAASHADGFGTHVSAELPESFDLDKLSVTLEPNAAVARRYTDITGNVWGGMLVFDGFHLDADDGRVLFEQGEPSHTPSRVIELGAAAPSSVPAGGSQPVRVEPL